MNNLIPLEFKNQRIITTKVLAEEFGAAEKNINDNFSNNKERFIEGKHYYKLEGQALKEFKSSLPDFIGEPLKFAPKLILWTERGAARHAKILDTDEAWDVYEELEETYFRVKNGQPSLEGLSPQLQALINLELEQKKIKQQLNQVNYNALEAKEEASKSREEIQAIREVVTLDTNSWRKDTATIINRIATKLGGFGHIQPIREEIYNLLDSTYEVKLQSRLLNKQKKMALEGVPKYKIDKVNKLDVISDDKKLINGYVNIVGKMAIKYGVA